MKQFLLLTIIVCMFVIPCVAQSNAQKSVIPPKAQKVTEVLYVCNTELDMRITEFVKALRKKPGAKAYVIVYANPEIAEYADFLISNTKRMLQERKITSDRIVILEGGFREYTTAEFFIVPKGALSPVPTLSRIEREH